MTQHQNKREESAKRTRTLSEACREIITTPAPRAISAKGVSGTLRAVETLLIFIAGLIQFKSGFELARMLLVLSVSLAMTQAAYHFGLYQLAMIRSRVSYPLKMMAIVCLVFSIIYGFLGFFELTRPSIDQYLRGWLISSLAIILFTRQLGAFLVRKWLHTGELLRRTVIVGGGENSESLIRTLQAQKVKELDLLGIFDDRMDERAIPEILGLKLLGTTEDMIEFARHTRVDLAICTIPVTAETRVLKMLNKLWILPLDIRLSAHTSKLRFASRNYSYIGDAAVLDVFDKPLKDSDIFVKFLFDRFIGLAFLILLSPIMLLTALLIKLDSKGPVFFVQKRYGFNNNPIDVWKFRSMYSDKTDFGGAKQVGKGDPRITKIGRLLRKTSIDELPQLFNVVFFGNLSLVGPRPHSVSQKFFEEVVDGYFARHKVKPGITGWAQINGWRGETDTEEKIQKRVEFDLQYTENWSLWNDFVILLKTPFSLFAHRDNAF
jgi:Undecaprenyl-phosphate glucose phosphotransferase